MSVLLAINISVSSFVRQLWEAGTVLKTSLVLIVWAWSKLKLNYTRDFVKLRKENLRPKRT
jgi:hypothetical protein